MTMARVMAFAVSMATVLFLVRPAPFVSREIREARERWRTGDHAGARAIAAAVLPELRREVKAQPGDPERHMALGEALALEGRATEALWEARSAVATHPAPAAPRGEHGESLVESLAIVAMEAGETEDALDALELLLAGEPVWEAGRLRADPRFAPLHADPRFERLLALYQRPGEAACVPTGHPPRAVTMR
jgi:hypothetical protein